MNLHARKNTTCLWWPYCRPSRPPLQHSDENHATPGGVPGKHHPARQSVQGALQQAQGLFRPQEVVRSSVALRSSSLGGASTSTE